MLDEWGVWDRIAPEDEKRNGRLWQQSTMRSAVAAGLGLNIFNRQADKLYMCNIAQMVNVLQSLLLTDGPTGRGLRENHDLLRLRDVQAAPLQDLRQGRERSHGPLDLSMSASKSGSELVISFVNPKSDAESPDRLRPGRPDGQERGGANPDAQGLQRGEYLREPERDPAAIASDSGGGIFGKAGSCPRCPL